MQIPGRLLIVLALLTARSASAYSVPGFAAADFVLGQSDLNATSAPVTPTAASLKIPGGICVDPTSGKIFVSDPGNNRVLRYASQTALQSGASAERVFGQGNFSNSGAAVPPTSASLNAPTGLWIDEAGRLWVADSANNRVVMYADAATVSTNAPDAALVLGQPGYVTSNATVPPTGKSLSGPSGLCVDAVGGLWVADTGNNRVVRFGGANQSAATLNKGDAASGHLGQGDYTSSTGGSGNTQLLQPVAVSMDASGTLWIADRGNNRVVGFASAAIAAGNSNAANASRVLGQPDFNNGSSGPGIGANRLNAPSGVFADAFDNLWTVDAGNHRLLRYSGLKSIESGNPADRIVGQANSNGSSKGGGARGLADPAGVFVTADRRLWVADSENNRVLRYSPVDDQIPTVAISGPLRRTTGKSGMTLRGTALDDTRVTRVIIQVNTKRPANASGTTRWATVVRLEKGRNVVRAVAIDAHNKRSRSAQIIVIRR